MTEKWSAWQWIVIMLLVAIYGRQEEPGSISRGVWALLAVMACGRALWLMRQAHP